MIESNSLIRASAGTGKTFALATRFIRQMLIDKVDPKTIVALTFSRAAAQEIYTKILMRLCAAAQDETGAAREWDTLLEDFRKGLVPEAAAKLAWIEAQAIPHAAEDFRRLLRALVDTQHLGAISTLDSFILRIVKNFPKEMGFQNAVEVLDPIDEESAVEDAVKGVLAKADGSGEAVARAFLQARDGEYARTCLAGINFILNRSGWRNFVIEHPDCANWTVESMCAALDVPLESTCPDLSGIPFNDMQRKNTLSPEENFVRWVARYDAARNPLDVSDSVRNLMLFFWNNPEATAYDYTFFKRPFTLRCGAAGAAAIRGAIRHLVNLHLKHQLEIVKAKIDLVRAVEAAYERMTRRAGKLTFNDFTKFSAEEEFSARGIAIQNVQFRFDAKFDHWALDEFQDTSELQWKCLRELVRNVADAGRAGECRSAMAVGDLKQSIYTWRGASAQPFEQLAGWASFDGCAREFKDSHRYGPNIADFVNRVFGPANLSREGLVPAACRDAVTAWKAGWTDHVSHEAPDYVKVVAAEKDADPEADDEILPALYAEIRTLWDRHRAEHSTDTVGVLVRNNDKGLKVAEYLRARGLPVVWEGVNPVHDLPVVEAVLALLRLGDHPEDTYAWRTVNDLFPIRRLLLPDCTGAAEASAAIARLLSRQGLARTLKDFCGILREKGGLLANGLSCERLKELVEMGVTYEARATGGGDVDGFVRFLAVAQKREIAVSSDVIRILTIHRSKGLGIDHVFVPLFEMDRNTAAIDAPPVSTPLYDGGDWVLSHLHKDVVALNAQTRAAYERLRSARLKEALRTYYVALTRSKKSLFVIFPDDSDPREYDKGLLMRDVIVEAVGHKLPFESGTMPSCAPKQAKTANAPLTRDVWPAVGRREIVTRHSPSKNMSGGEKTPAWMKASWLFKADYGQAAQRGIDVHAAYEKIEWADPETAARLPEAFREAFVRPAGEASVWRERSYEIFADGAWETGQFDRVVFRGTGSARTATIYDFKTNARGQEEEKAQFAQRLRAVYAPQMKAYRHALASLTGLAADRIQTKLLLEATGQVVEI